jgi:hypothetical protein
VKSQVVLTTFASFQLIAASAAKADARNIKCDESKVMPIYIRVNYATVVNFPVKPDNVLLGSSNQFGVQYIKNDIALTALNSTSNTNMYVYLFGRRCAFVLSTTKAHFDSVVRIIDPDENRVKVKFSE